MKYAHFEELAKLKADGFISARPHPVFPLTIYNYTVKSQMAPLAEWTQPMKDCRGLILDEAGEIVGRPFRKFWNLEQVSAEVPAEDFLVWEKLDGSLGIVCSYAGERIVATRGSFESDQAICAADMLHTIYRDSLLDNSFTYLFEIIAEHNRIVVNYGEQRALVLIAVIHTNTGLELNELPEIGFPRARSFDPSVVFGCSAGTWSMSAQSTCDDSGKHDANESGVENLQGLPKQIAQTECGKTNAGEESGGSRQCAQVGRAKQRVHIDVQETSIPRISRPDHGVQGRTVHGLQENVPALCDGLRSSTGGNEEISHNPTHWKSKSGGYIGGNSQMRCRLCKLSPDQDVQFGSTNPIAIREGTDEGFVIKFKSGFRCKVKKDEYKRLHRLITQCSTRTIWEMLKTGAGIQHLVDRVPDEFALWVREKSTEIEQVKCLAEFEAYRLIDINRDRFPVRKDFSMWAKEQRNPSLLFSLLDGKDITEACWKLAEPKWSTPFRKDIDG